MVLFDKSWLEVNKPCGEKDPIVRLIMENLL